MKKLTAEWKSIMYKVLLDTNILLDYLLTERPGNAAAQRIMEMTVEGQLTSYISPISLLNIFFILRKQRTEQERKEIIESLLEILDITDLDLNDLQSALYIPIDDYEDGVQYISAVKIDVDFIITGDQQFQKYDLELKMISPEEFLTNYS
jgi:predicted nucleic acid-binding protein